MIFVELTTYATRVLLLIIATIRTVAAIEACPMREIEAVIDRVSKSAPGDAAAQMQVIRKVMEDVFGGTWGVLVIEDPTIVSQEVHWTIPDFQHEGKRGFCLHIHNGFQYNVFKTGNVDVKERLSIEELVGAESGRDTGQKTGQKTGRKTPAMRLNSEEYASKIRQLRSQTAAQIHH